MWNQKNEFYLKFKILSSIVTIILVKFILNTKHPEYKM